MDDEVKERRIGGSKGNKPIVFQRTRRLLVAGILTAGIFFGTPYTLRGEYFKNTRGPPVTSYFEKNYPVGWRYLMRAEKLSNEKRLSEGNYQKALKYFKKMYKNDPKNLKLLFIYAYCYYGRARDGDIKAAKKDLLKAIKLSEKGLKQCGESFLRSFFLDLKALSLYHIGFMYYNYGEHNMGIRFYRKAKKWLERFLEFYSEYKKELNEFDQEYETEIASDVKNMLRKIDKILKK